MSDWCPYCFGEVAAGAACPTCSREHIDPDPNDLPAGTAIDARYMVGRALGRGGFGITYLGWQQMPARRVAIKEYLPQTVAKRARDGRVVPSSAQAETEFLQGIAAFGEEAQRLADFQGQPHIVGVYDFVHAFGTAYMVMEYCPGQTALEYLQTYGGRLAYEDTLAIVTPVLEALQILHARSVYHRDVSPDNILLTEQGVKLIDFGAARTALRDRSASFSAILKMAYAPPEQYSRRGSQGPWTDVYATAATMYHLLTGAPPPGAMDRQVQDDIVPPSRMGVKLPAAADQAIMNALALDINRRTQSAYEFGQQLQHAGSRREVKPPVRQPPGPGRQPVVPARPSVVTEGRAWLPFALILFAFVVLPLGGFAVWWAMSGTPQIVAFNVDPEHATAGQSVKISWHTTGVSQVELSPIESGGVLPARGEMDVVPMETTTYTITAAGKGTSVTNSRTVIVDAPPLPPVAAGRRGAIPLDDAGRSGGRGSQPKERNPGQEAAIELDRVVKNASQKDSFKGFARDDAAGGKLKTGQTDNWEVTLEVKNDYLFIGACDRDCDNLDLHLRSKDLQTLFIEDVDTDATPVISFIPPADGKYIVAVSMVGCKNDPCTVLVARFARPRSTTDR